jgi:hypothetical protein
LGHNDSYKISDYQQSKALAPSRGLPHTPSSDEIDDYDLGFNFSDKRLSIFPFKSRHKIGENFHGIQ